MKKSNVNYPYPVLNSSNEDFIDCLFNIEIIEGPICEADTVSLKIKYVLKSPGLEAYIKEEKACAVVYLESVVAEYRKIRRFNFDEDTMTININKQDVNKMIEIRGYIVSLKEIKNYKLDEHNKELFGNMPFNIRAGDMLAIANDFYKIPLENYDPLLDRPSIFSIRHQTDNPNEEIVVDTNTPTGKIDIILNKDIYTRFQSLYEAPDTRTVLSTLLAAPVLVDVLNQLKYMDQDSKEALENKKWFQVITHRLKDLNIDLEQEDCMTKVANKILPHIFDSAILAQTKLCDTLLKDGDTE